jgi:hypothetical protein
MSNIGDQTSSMCCDSCVKFLAYCPSVNSRFSTRSSRARCKVGGGSCGPLLLVKSGDNCSANFRILGVFGFLGSLQKGGHYFDDDDIIKNLTCNSAFALQERDSRELEGSD